MALTITYSGDWLQNAGSLMVSKVSATLGTYATGGISFTPANAGLGAFVGSPEFELGSGYLAGWDSTNQKILVYRSAGFTPAGSGTAAAQTFTGESYTPAGTNASSTVTGNVIVKGGAIGEATGINPDSTSGVLSKAAATDRTIPVETYAGAAWTAPAQTFSGTPHTLAGTNATSAVTFTGSAVSAAAFAEVSNGVDLSAVTIHIRAFGR